MQPTSLIVLFSSSSEEAFLEKFFEGADIAMGRFILKEGSSFSALVAVCHIIASYRAGHLYVEYTKSKLSPLPEAIWKEEVLDYKENHDMLSAFIIEAFEELKGKDFLVTDKNRRYLKRAFLAEQEIAFEVHRLLNASVSIPLEFTRIKHAADSLIEEKKLFPEQAVAIKQAFERSVSVIYGGPGSGKTHTAAFFLRLFLEFAETKPKIVIAAPTGKALANIEGSILRLFSQEEVEETITFITLHKLLTIVPFSRKREQKITQLPYDLFLVDESSMIDVHLMRHFLRFIASGARVIFLGDPDQLPSIDPGAPFAALVAALEKKGHTKRLENSVRALSSQIPVVANEILKASAEAILSCPKEIENPDGVFFHPITDKEQMQAVLESYFHLLYIKKNIDGLAPKELQKHFQNVRLLSPVKSGPLGVDSINAFLQVLVEKEARKRNGNYVMPIIITKNDYELDITNGQTGLLIQQNGVNNTSDELQVVIETKKEIRVLPQIILPSFDLAFCLSIHKSQGSEFDDTWIFLPKTSWRFGRKMLYTAVTRAKKRVRIWAEPETIKQVLAHDGSRNTTLQSLLENIV